MLTKTKLLVVLISTILLFSACFNSGGDSPSENLRTFANAIIDNDMNKALNYLTDDSVEGLSEIYNFIVEIDQGDPETKKELENEIGVSLDELKNMNERDRLALLMEKTGDNPFASEDMEFDIISDEINGDEAIVTIKIQSGKEIPITMIKEDGIWKLEYK